VLPSPNLFVGMCGFFSCMLLTAPSDSAVGPGDFFNFEAWEGNSIDYIFCAVIDTSLWAAPWPPKPLCFDDCHALSSPISLQSAFSFQRRNFGNGLMKLLRFFPSWP